MTREEILEELRIELESLFNDKAGRTYGEVRARELLSGAIAGVQAASRGKKSHSEIVLILETIGPLLSHRERARTTQLLSELLKLTSGNSDTSTPSQELTSYSGSALTARAKKRVPANKMHRSSAPAILIMTAAQVEYETALELAGVRLDLRSRRRAVDGHIFVDLGFEHCPVWLFQCKKGAIGPGSATTRTTEALMSLVPRPFAVIASGIAFGLQPQKQRMGDVLVGEQIRLYEVERRGAHQRLNRGDRPATSETLLDWFRSCELDWNYEHGGESRPGVHYGLVLSGEKLVDDPNFVENLLYLEPEAIGGEMEAAGVYSAAYSRQTHWAVVKGICDWGIGKGDKHQEVAASNALDFVYHTLDQPAVAHALYSHGLRENHER